MKNLRSEILEAFLMPYDDVMDKEEFPIIIPSDFFSNDPKTVKKVEKPLSAYENNGKIMEI